MTSGELGISLVAAYLKQRRLLARIYSRQLEDSIVAEHLYDLPDGTKVQLTKDAIIGLMEESVEVLNELNHKAWRTDLPVDENRLRGEIRDVLQFTFNLVSLWYPGTFINVLEELMTKWHYKLKVNHDRFDQLERGEANTADAPELAHRYRNLDDHYRVDGGSELPEGLGDRGDAADQEG